MSHRIVLVLAIAALGLFSPAAASGRQHHGHGHHPKHHAKHHTKHHTKARRSDVEPVEICVAGGEPECAMYTAAEAAEIESGGNLTPAEERELEAFHVIAKAEEEGSSAYPIFP